MERIFEQFIETTRPVEETVFERIENRLRSLSYDKEDFLVVDFVKDKDNLLFMQTKRKGKSWYVEMAWDMRRNGRTSPLIRGARLSLDKTLELFRQICMEGQSPESVRVIQDRFKETDSDVVDDVITDQTGMGKGIDLFMRNPWYRKLYEEAPSDEVRKHLLNTYEYGWSFYVGRWAEKNLPTHLNREDVQYLYDHTEGGYERAFLRKILAGFDEKETMSHEKRPETE